MVVWYTLNNFSEAWNRYFIWHNFVKYRSLYKAGITKEQPAEYICICIIYTLINVYLIIWIPSICPYYFLICLSSYIQPHHIFMLLAWTSSLELVSSEKGKWWRADLVFVYYVSGSIVVILFILFKSHKTLWVRDYKHHFKKVAQSYTKISGSQTKIFFVVVVLFWISNTVHGLKWISSKKISPTTVHVLPSSSL